MLFGHSAELPIIYASTSGNVETVVQYVAKVLDTQRVKTALSRAEQTPVEWLSKHPRLILATSTWEHGELNPFFHQLYDAMASMDFHGKEAAFIGLGDRRYEPVLFCEGMEKVRRRWLEQGGSEVIEPLRIQGEPYALLETLVEPWVMKFATTWK